MIEIRDLIVSADGRSICTVPELSVAAGVRLVIVGDNGAGKTTLLRLLAGLDETFAGTLEIDAPVRERTYVHQSPFMFRGSVLANVQYGLRARNMSRDERTRLAHEWADVLQLRQLLSSSVSHLSGGEKRRVALARAMVCRPRLLLLDEPFSDLDETGREAVLDAMRRLSTSTIIMTSPCVLGSDVAAQTFKLCK